MLARVKTIGTHLGARQRQAFGAYPHVGDIRSQGALWASEFVTDRTTRAPSSAQFAHRVFAFADGLIVPVSGRTDGVNGNLVIVAPPFTITKDEWDEIVMRLQSHAVIQA